MKQSKSRKFVSRLFLLPEKIVLLLITQKTKFGIQYANAEWEKISSINANRISALAETPWGILAGEFDSRLFLKPPPINALFLSRDQGVTWEKIGLDGRGILDIKYYAGKIYVTTYYVINNSYGIFVSEDGGTTWYNINIGSSTNKIDRDSKTIYVGSTVDGLYVSTDEGETWREAFDTGGSTMSTIEVESSEDITLVSIASKVYKTLDNGETWDEITQLRNKGIVSFCINGSIIFAGSGGARGMYVSKNSGETWEKIVNFGDNEATKIVYLKGRYYAVKYSFENYKYWVYVSSDVGKTWFNSDPNMFSVEIIEDLIPINSSSQPSLLSSVIIDGIYKYNVPIGPVESPFLNIPWEYKEENEITDKITSFFDHRLPLLGYGYYSEPTGQISTTTMNFLGMEAAEPTIYYSSHSGLDFGLEYGTEILASSSGYASYYYCKDCGNTIKIDHQNGYQTTYMHLQNDSLITKSDPVWVNSNDTIGKVGLTGRTSGPHLHFEVTKDKEMDGNFLNDFPSGRVDPFGWRPYDKVDPWSTFSWEDALGFHSGSTSPYLWNTESQEKTGIISPGTSPNNKNYMEIGNKRIEFENLKETLTVKIFPYIKPALNLPSKMEGYIENTSFILQVFNQNGTIIDHFDDPINMVLTISPDSLKNIKPQSVRLYFWNQVTRIWELVSSSFDEENNKITASTNHLSWFAAFGEKDDPNPPNTQIAVSGSQTNGWFNEFPLIQFSYENGDASEIKNTIYSTDDGDTWDNYSEPFYLEKDGIVNLLYKSIDLNDNIEPEKNYVLHINVSGKKTEKIKVSGSSFKIIR